MCSYDIVQYAVFVVGWCNSFLLTPLPHISIFETLFALFTWKKIETLGETCFQEEFC